MRANATLEAEQKKDTIVPYVHFIELSSPPLISVDTTSNRILRVISLEQTYSLQAIVQLNNYDGAYNNLELRGKKCKLGWGAVCAGVNEGSYAPYLWVCEQSLISSPGKSVFELRLEGIFDKLYRYTFEANKWWNMTAEGKYDPTKTIKNIIYDILALLGLSLGTSISEDTRIDTIMPELEVTPTDNAFGAIYELLGLTDCVLVPREDTVCIKYPQASDPIDYEYRTAAAHWVRDSESAFALPPLSLKVIVYADKYTGPYPDPLWDSTMGVSWVDARPLYNVVQSDAECEAYAKSIVERRKAEVSQGECVAPIMNCLQELNDKVKITDTRNNTEKVGWVGALRRELSRGVYSLRVRLGGLNEWSLIEGITPMPVPPLETSPEGAFAYHAIPPSMLTQATQPYAANLDWGHPGDANDYRNVKWSTPANEHSVGFKDGTEFDILDNDYYTKFGAYLTSTHFIYFSTGDKEIYTTTSFLQAINSPNGLLAIAVFNSDTEGKALILPASGKAPLLNALVMTANMILAEHIKAGAVEAGKIAAGAVTAGEIAVGALSQPNSVLNPSFEYGDWGGDETASTDYSKYGKYSGKLVANGANIYSAMSNWINIKGWDKVTVAAWVNITALTTASFWLTIRFYDTNRAACTPTDHIDLAQYTATQDWAQVSHTYAATDFPSDCVYIRVRMAWWNDIGDPSGTAYVDGWQVHKGEYLPDFYDGTVMVGTPDAQRVEITPRGVEGYSDAGVKQFYLQSSDGKAMAGGGNVILDTSGINFYGEGMCNFYCDATQVGFLNGYAGGIRLGSEKAATNCWVDLATRDSGGNWKLVVLDSQYPALYPSPEGNISLGRSGYPWLGVHSHYFYGGGATLTDADIAKLDCGQGSGRRLWIPSMTDAQRQAISGADLKDGLMVYTTDTVDIWFYCNGAWHCIHAF